MSADKSSSGAKTPAYGQAISSHATIVEGVAHNGKPCRLVDNTGSIERADLEGLLEELVAAKRFGISGMSTAGSSTIRLGTPEFTHLQMGGDLYRLILFPYEARIEAF